MDAFHRTAFMTTVLQIRMQFGLCIPPSTGMRARYTFSVDVIHSSNVLYRIRRDVIAAIGNLPDSGAIQILANFVR